METVDSHSFMPFHGGWVLDAGARGFGFTGYFLDRGCKVIALEPDKSCKPIFTNQNLCYHDEALWTEDKEMPYSSWSTGEGNMIHEPELYKTDNFNYMTHSSAQCHTIEYYMEKHGIKIFELIKLDIEGSEFPVMEQYIKQQKVLTKQFSIEWHYFTGQNEHRNFNQQILKDPWWLDTYTCIKSDLMDSVYILRPDNASGNT